jgi:uncharacterized protein (DUF1330 family)
MSGYFEPTPEQGRDLMLRGLTGPVTMLNLLRFRAQADYSGSPELAPAAPISGKHAYELYMAHTTPFLREAGGSLGFLGEGGPMAIGPADERWDLVLLVKYPGVDAFISFATNQAYRAGLGHRTAALADSRLLPIVEKTP